MLKQPPNATEYHEDGDKLLWACDQREKGTLTPGLVNDGRNLRFTDGVPETRRGVTKPPWANSISAGSDFVRSHGTPYGLGRFQDPDGVEWMIKAQDGYAWRTRPYNQPVSLPLPTGVKLLTRTKFVQAFNKLFAFRGRHLAPLVLNDIDTGFEDIVSHWTAAKTYAAGDEVAHGPWLAVDSVTRAGDVATVTTHEPHEYITGADITLRGAVETEFNGRFNITVVDAYSFTFRVTNPVAKLASGALTSVSTTATVHLPAHGFVTGQSVLIAGAAQTEYNGTFTIASATADEFTYTFAGSATTPATGTITVKKLTTVTPATGTITCSNMLQYWAANDAPNTPVAGESPDGAPTKWTRIYNILPNAHTALYINNRLLVPTAYEPASTDSYASFSGGGYKKTDYLVATSYLDYVHFDFSDEFRINQGSDDEIVDLARVPNEDSVIVWKGHSWGILSGVTLDLSNLRLDMRSTVYGLSCPDAWAECGGNIVFLSNRRGIISIRQSEQGKLIGVDVPLSAPIQKTIDRIDWTHSSLARLVNHDNRLYAAVPLTEVRTEYGDNLVAMDVPFNYQGWVAVGEFVPGATYQYWIGNAERMTTDIDWTPGTVLDPAPRPAGDVIAHGEFTATNYGLYLWGTAGVNPTTTIRAVAHRYHHSVLVYDWVAATHQPGQGWTPRDTGSALAVREWVKIHLDGVERLFFVDADGWVNLMEESEVGDQIADATAATGLAFEEIETEVVSRSYGGSLNSFVRPVELALSVATFNPKYTVRLVFDGVSKLTTVAENLTRNRLKYYRPFGKRDYDPTNVNTDAADPYREDYSVVMPADGIALGNGVNVGQFQEYLHTVRASGRQSGACQLQLTNTQGRVRLLGVRVKSAPGRSRKGLQG